MNNITLDQVYETLKFTNTTKYVKIDRKETILWKHYQ